MDVGSAYRYLCLWVKPQHPKILLCACGDANWGFFFNSEARTHGIGQLPCTPADNPGVISKDCFLDLSGMKAMTPRDVANAAAFGAMRDEFQVRVIASLTEGNDLLSEAHRSLALSNFTKKFGKAAGAA